MARSWTCHWRFSTWRPDINSEGMRVRSSGSNSFRKRGVSPGDKVYVVSLKGGQLYLGGRYTVERIVSRMDALRLFDRDEDSLYDADEWAIDLQQTGTLLDLHRRLAPEMTKQLRFVSPSGPKEPCFISATELDNQATRGVRELTAESAALLDRVIAVTDGLPKSVEVVVVTEDMLVEVQTTTSTIDYADVVEQLGRGPGYSLELLEGATFRVTLNGRVRSQKARELCVALYGSTCFVCEFDFGRVYGPAVEGFTHVHHLRPLSETSGESAVDPATDLRPVCPNCHAVLHARTPPYSITEVQALMVKQQALNPAR